MGFLLPIVQQMSTNAISADGKLAGLATITRIVFRRIVGFPAYAATTSHSGEVHGLQRRASWLEAAEPPGAGGPGSVPGTGRMRKPQSADLK